MSSMSRAVLAVSGHVAVRLDLFFRMAQRFSAPGWDMLRNLPGRVIWDHGNQKWDRGWDWGEPN